MALYRSVTISRNTVPRLAALLGSVTPRPGTLPHTTYFDAMKIFSYTSPYGVDRFRSLSILADILPYACHLHELRLELAYDVVDKFVSLVGSRRLIVREDVSIVDVLCLPEDSLSILTLPRLRRLYVSHIKLLVIAQNRPVRSIALKEVLTFNKLRRFVAALEGGMVARSLVVLSVNALRGDLGPIQVLFAALGFAFPRLYCLTVRYIDCLEVNELKVWVFNWICSLY